MHRVEAEYLSLVANEQRPPFFNQAMRDAGVPVELQERMDRALRDVRRMFRPHDPHWLLEGGEKIPVRGGTLEVVWTPGHSPGHVCLYSPEHRYLISGDHILEFITPNIGWHPDQDMLAHYLDVARKASSFRRGSGAAVARRSISRAIASASAPPPIITKSAAARFCGFLAREPLTANTLVERVWPRKLSAFHHHFAVFEILAHLEYLQRQGRVASESRDGALYWQSKA